MLIVEGEPPLLTLCIHYKFDPNKLAAFQTYLDAEQTPIQRSGGKIVGYFLPTDYSGPTDEAYGLIDFPALAAYEQYRGVLAEDPDHRRNVAELERSGAVHTMARSIIQRIGNASATPVSLEELRKLEACAGWSEEDASWLKLAAGILVPQAEEMVDHWRSKIASQPDLAAAFVGPDAKPDERYKAAVKARFVQWVSDVCLHRHDQDWLDYQEEIGLRHTPSRKNKTDGSDTPPVVPQRYLLGFTAVVITSTRGFLMKSGKPDDEITRMQDAWTRAVLLSIALWSRAYAENGLW